MERTKLSTTKIESLKAAPKGQRRDLYDTEVRGLCVRITDTGHKSYVLRGRLDGQPQRFTIGEVGKVSLERARQIALDWNELLRRGKSPKEERERLRREEQRRRADKLGAVMEEFFRRKLKNTRTGKKVEQDLRRELKGWWDKPVVDISRRDVVELIEAKAETAPCRAHHLFSYIGRFFNWATHRDVYGIERSPLERLNAVKLIGPRNARTRVLTDDEIAVFWKATKRMGYPFGPLFQMLLLTGARRSEASDAQWREIDVAAALWTVPSERFKSKREHVVPLSEGALALLRALPRFEGEYVFTTTGGRKPVDGFSKAKERCDRLMLRYLRALARLRGDDPAKAALRPWVLHDLRRTVRTRMAALKIQDTVAELVIGHAPKGLMAVYMQHGYHDEIRAALETWHAAVQSIVSLKRTPTNVVQLRVLR